MKKRFWLPLLLALLLAFPVVASASTHYYVSGTSWLKMRQLPKTTALVLASYRTDYATTSYKKYNSEWAYVTFSDGHEGYVQKKYLKSCTSYSAYVTTNGTHLRTGPAATFGSITTLDQGEKVTVYTTGSSWSFVSSPAGNGYIKKTYLSTKAVNPSTAADFPFYAYVTNPNNNKVNFRKGPGTGQEILAELTPGTKVTVKGVSGSWYLIEYSGTDGYMMSKYLSKDHSGAQPEAPAAPTFVPSHINPGTGTTAYIVSENGKSVNVRNGAGTGYGQIAQLKVGTAVTVLGYKNSWANISFEGRSGYVMEKYISSTKPAVVVTPEPDPGSVTPTSGTAVVSTANGKSLNFRRGPGSGYALVYGQSSIPNGATVEIVGSDGGRWAKVKYNGFTGYVLYEFLSY